MSKECQLQGIVKRGAGRGATTGAKTANLDVALAVALPKQGLYEAIIIAARRKYSGLLYYGINMLSGQECLEVHLFNFTGVLYRKKIVVSVGRYLRPPKKFKTLTALKRQIAIDIAKAVKL